MDELINNAGRAGNILWERRDPRVVSPVSRAFRAHNVSAKWENWIFRCVSLGKLKIGDKYRCETPIWVQNPNKCRNCQTGLAGMSPWCHFRIYPGWVFGKERPECPQELHVTQAAHGLAHHWQPSSSPRQPGEASGVFLKHWDVAFQIISTAMIHWRVPEVWALMNSWP